MSGTAWLDGKPLPEGIVFFKTVHTGSIDRVDVLNGEFKGEVEPGSRRVEICAYKSVAMGEGEMKTEEKVNWIPARFNTNSTLTAEVKPQETNEFKFEVASR